MPKSLPVLLAVLIVTAGCSSRQYMYNTGFHELQTGMTKDWFLEMYAEFPPDSSRTFSKDGDTWQVLVYKVYNRESIESGYPWLDHYEYTAFRNGRLAEWGTGDGIILRADLDF